MQAALHSICFSLAATPAAERSVLNDAFEALLSLGYNAVEAREKLDVVGRSKQKFKTVEDVILAIYQQERG